MVASGRGEVRVVVSGMASMREPTRTEALVLDVPCADHVIRYALSLVRQTRVGEPGTPEFVEEMVGWGAGPRGMQYLLLGGKARSVLEGRFFVSTEDIRAVAHPVLRHRIITNFYFKHISCFFLQDARYLLAVLQL